MPADAVPARSCPRSARTRRFRGSGREGAAGIGANRTRVRAAAAGRAVGVGLSLEAPEADAEVQQLVSLKIYFELRWKGSVSFRQRLRGFASGAGDRHCGASGDGLRARFSLAASRPLWTCSREHAPSGLSAFCAAAVTEGSRG